MGLLWALLAILLLFWLFGFVANVAGGLIHILLVIALVLLIWNLLAGRNARV